MPETIQLLNDIFESELTINDMEKEVKEVLEWDSFHLMNFLVEIEERFGKRVSIEDISMICSVCDLVNIVENR